MKKKKIFAPSFAYNLLVKSFLLLVFIFELIMKVCIFYTYLKKNFKPFYWGVLLVVC